MKTSLRRTSVLIALALSVAACLALLAGCGSSSSSSSSSYSSSSSSVVDSEYCGMWIGMNLYLPDDDYTDPMPLSDIDVIISVSIHEDGTGNILIDDGESGDTYDASLEPVSSGGYQMFDDHHDYMGYAEYGVDDSGTELLMCGLAASDGEMLVVECERV